MHINKRKQQRIRS